MATHFTFTNTAFVRPATHSFLSIRDESLESYTPYAVQLQDEAGNIVNFAAPMALNHPDGSLTPVTVEMLLELTGRTMVVPFYAPKSDDHSFAYAALGYSSEAARRESAEFAEKTRQDATMKSRGITADYDWNEIARVSDAAAALSGGAGYGLLFETPLDLYDGTSCNVFVGLRQLMQLLVISNGQKMPYVNDQTVRHLNAPRALREIVFDHFVLNGGVYIGYATRVDGTPLIRENIADTYQPWQNLAETLAYILASPDAAGKTVAHSYIAVHTMVEMMWANVTQAHHETYAVDAKATKTVRTVTNLSFAGRRTA